LDIGYRYADASKPPNSLSELTIKVTDDSPHVPTTLSGLPSIEEALHNTSADQHVGILKQASTTNLDGNDQVSFLQFVSLNLNGKFVFNIW